MERIHDLVTTNVTLRTTSKYITTLRTSRSSIYVVVTREMRAARQHIRIDIHTTTM
jgi:hypothetical protein